MPSNQDHIGGRGSVKSKMITGKLKLDCSFKGVLGYSSNDSFFYAAIVAVVAVHVILALFVYVAWNEGSQQSRVGKQD